MKVNRTELIYHLVEAINSLSEEKDPTKELVAMGEALAKIGKALQGMSLNKARAVMKTIQHMHESGLMDIGEDEEKTSTPETGKEK